MREDTTPGAATAARTPDDGADRFRLGLSGCAGGLEAVSTAALLGLAELAETLGFDGLWLNEEHFQGSRREVEGRRCLSPIVLASAILARTRRLRVGFSVLLLPLHHPIRLAEEIATLDVLSDGRVDFGISRGANQRYLPVFGSADLDPDAQFHHHLDLVLRAWQDAPLPLGTGTHSVEPKPVQRPHPPVFIGTHTPRTAAWAAENGHAIICHGITNLSNVQQLVDAFTGAGGDARGVPIGRFVYVGESDAQAREELWPTILKLTTRLQSIGIASKGRVMTERDLRPEVFYDEMVIAGSARTCAEKIRHLQATLGSRYLNALSAFFGFLPLPLLERSLRLLAGEVRTLVATAPARTP